MIWNENYFSKFEFVIHCGCEIIGYFECNLMMSELSYQECGNTGVIVFEYSHKLSEKELSKILPHILLSDFGQYRHDRIPFEEKKIVGVRDIFSITFKGYSQDGQPLLTYEMEFIYKDWYRRPIDKLYSFISDTYFLDFQNDRCFLAHGLMASVHPV
ncbi:hypothetical protein [Streptococcus pluranimalium]|uniref:hypothetical protein n=1 Tax=Streptococcus pluranimalium TaxID=82348 RepID=UPI003F68F3E5